MSNGVESQAPPGPARRGRPPKTGEEDVARAALRIADTEGLAALSMRRLADELGVSATTIYLYFANKDDLLERLRVTTLAALDIDLSSSMPWRELLFTSIRGVYRAFREHPSGSELLFSMPGVLHSSFRHLADRMIGLLVKAGFSTDEAAGSIRALLVYAAGVANHERIQARRLDGLDQRLAAGGDPDELEEVSLARELVHPIPPEIFETGLQGAIDALGARYERPGS